MALRANRLWCAPSHDEPESRPSRNDVPRGASDQTDAPLVDESAAELAGSIAHDLNNLLDVISKLAALQARGQDLSQTVQISRRIEAAVLRAAKLTHRLFDLGAPVAERTELPGALAEVADLVRVSAGENVVIQTFSDPQTWAVTVDASDLQRAIMNLAINSVRAMPGGGTLVMTTLNTVLSEQRRADLRLDGREFVEIRVADSGRGMTPDTLAHAFEPHFTTKPDSTGTGLGLAQVQAFVQQSNGALQVTTSPGAGTTISLYLPSAAARL
jgi:signal transduction histidine kinase